MGIARDGFVRTMLGAVAASTLALLLTACGGAGKPGDPPQVQMEEAAVAVSVSPNATSISAGGTQTFAASVSGTSNTGVT